jgi:hypothetical protein
MKLKKKRQSNRVSVLKKRTDAQAFGLALMKA